MEYASSALRWVPTPTAWPPQLFGDHYDQLKTRLEPLETKSQDRERLLEELWWFEGYTAEGPRPRAPRPRTVTVWKQIRSTSEGLIILVKVWARDWWRKRYIMRV